MTFDELKKCKAAQLASNRHLFVGGVAAQKPQPDRRREEQDRELESRPRSVAYHIRLTSLRPKLLDDDNHIASLKPLRDAITESLGFTNDADPLLSWSYRQRKAHGHHGVRVRLRLYLI